MQAASCAVYAGIRIPKRRICESVHGSVRNAVHTMTGMSMLQSISGMRVCVLCTACSDRNIEKTVGHTGIARLCFALSNNRTKIPHFKRLLSGGMSHRIFLFILDFILSMTLNSHVHADRHFRFQKCLLFVKLYIFLYL